MKKIKLILVSLCWAIVLIAQDIVFNKTYNAQTPGLSNIIIQEDGYVSLGFDVNLGKVRIYILKTDFYGDTIWTKKYGSSDYSFYNGTQNSLIENFNGGYSLSSHRTNPETDYRACMLTKFDQNFDTLWTKLYFDNPDFTVFYNHIQTADGGYALVGCTTESDTDGDVLLVKTESDGNMLWYKKYGTSGRDVGFCIVETPDNGFLIGGNSSAYGNKDGYLIKIDNERNLEWSKHFGNSLYPDGSIYTIIQSGNSYFIPLSSYVTDPISEDFYNRRYSIIKLDAAYDEVWNKIYGVRAEYTGLGTITIDNTNGDILATVTDNHVSGLMRISNDGDSISTHYYIPNGSVGENALLAIKQTPDNGFIMAGVAYDPQVMWLVKTDSCGCVVEECECGGSEVETFWVNNKIEVYPNPASKEVWIEYLIFDDNNGSKIEIFDIEGRLVMTQAIRNGYGIEEIDVSSLSEGSYILKIGKYSKKLDVMK